MTQVGIAELKAHLSQYLRAARAGGVIEVLDRGVPVARIMAPDWAAAGLARTPPKRKLSDLQPPPPSNLPFDIVEELLKTRRNDR